jgi:hypothetical protein
MEEQRVICDQQVDRLRLDMCHDIVGHLMADGDRPHLGTRISQLDAHRIPLRSRIGPGPLGEGFGDVGD